MTKLTVSFVREALLQLDKEEISFSRFVEMLNEKAESTEEPMWAAGPVRCDLCGFEWAAAYQHGTPQLECSNCGNMVNYTAL